MVEDTPEVLTVEAFYTPRGNRPPAHYHPRQDEHFKVLEGSLRVQADGAQRDLHAGEFLDIPPGKHVPRRSDPIALSGGRTRR